MEDNRIVNWIKVHKKGLVITGITIAGTVAGTVLVIKNWDTIKSLLKNLEPTTPELAKVKPVVEKIATPAISSDILATLSIGETITFLGQISSVETESEGIGMGIITMVHILFSNAVLLETTPQQAGDSKE